MMLTSFTKSHMIVIQQRKRQVVIIHCFREFVAGENKPMSIMNTLWSF